MKHGAVNYEELSNMTVKGLKADFFFPFVIIQLSLPLKTPIKAFLHHTFNLFIVDCAMFYTEEIFF